jgi:hypothetical protein
MLLQDASMQEIMVKALKVLAIKDADKRIAEKVLAIAQ